MIKFQGKLARAVLLEDFSYLVSMGESVHSHLFDKRLPRGALCILPHHHADAYTLTEQLHLPEGDVLLSFFINFFSGSHQDRQFLATVTCLPFCSVSNTQNSAGHSPHGTHASRGCINMLGSS